MRDTPELTGPDPEPAGFTVNEAPADPLAGLVERAAIDPGAPFANDVIEALAEQRASNRAAFESLRAKLKAVGVRVAELDKRIAQARDGAVERQTQAGMLLDLAASAELFHTRDKTGYADISIAGHRETWPIRSKGFRRWIGRAYYEAHGGAPNNDAMQSALGVLEARAHYDAPDGQIFLRIGELGNKLYLDLGDEAWRAIEIDATGWRVVAAPPVRFRRAAGMLPLPEPTRGGSLDALRRLVNVSSDDDFRLAVAWLLAAFRPTGPYPVLIVTGEGGSAKTTFVMVLRALTDPNTSPLRSLPREDRDLFIAATNGFVLAFDNISGLPTWISDTLCRISTGGGFAVRALYTDGDETLFDAMRPIALNGIENSVERADLADRGLFLTLTRIPDDKRREDAVLRADLEAVRPAILGALLDAVSHGLQRLPETKLDRLPRLADFARWATACGDGLLWEPGQFIKSYFSNRQGAVLDVIEADPVAAAVKAFMEREGGADRAAGRMRTVRTHTASSLMAALHAVAGEAVTKSNAWPKSPRALSGRLRRAATFLRDAGIAVEFSTIGHAKVRSIELSAENIGLQPSAPSAPSAMADSCGFRADGCLLGAGPDRPQPSAADGSTVRIMPDRPHTVRSNPLISNGEGDADGADAKIPTRTAPDRGHMVEGEL